MQDYSIIKEKAFQEIEKATTSSELVDLRVKYLGKTGEISLLMKNMKDIAPEERASFGKIVNELKTDKIGLEEYYINLMANKEVK